MKIIAVIFLILLIVVFIAAIHWVKNVVKTSIKELGPQKLTRPEYDSPEWMKNRLKTQFANPERPKELKRNGHMRRKPRRRSSFKDEPCWLRLERDGFYVDYNANIASWKVEPLPADAGMGMCDHNGIISIYRTDGGTWLYDAFQRKKFGETDPVIIERRYPNAPGEGEIDMTDAEHVNWVKRQDDPELWDAAAMAAVAFLGDEHDFLPWLIQQEKFDRSTAGWIFLWADAVAYLRGESKFLSDGISGEKLVEALDNIVRRSETRGFSYDELGLSSEFESQRQACLALRDSGEVAPVRIFPNKLLYTPFKEREKTYFSLEDGGIVHV